MIYKWLMAIFFLLSGYIPARSYSYPLKHIGSQEGLPHQQVEALAQDKSGYVWIGTRNGLVRYDGYEMKCYYHEQGNPRSLINNFVKRLFSDSRGRVWVCTPEGVARYNPKTDDFRTYGSKREYILDITETSDGKMILAGNGLYMYNEQGDSLSALPTPDTGFILSLAIDPQGNLFFASNTSINYYDRTFNKLTQLDNFFYKDFLTGADGVVPMMFDHAGHLWVGRNGKGVSRIDLKSQKIDTFFPTELVRCINEDQDHNISLGTEKGIFILRPDGTTEEMHHDLLHPNLLSDNAVYALLADEDGNHWVGTYFGGVDIMLNGTLKYNWMKPGVERGDVKGRILRTMIETEPGELWVATEGDGLVIIDLKSEDSRTFTRIPAIGNNVHSLYYDRKKNEIWIGTFRSGLFRYNLKTGAYRRYLRERGLGSDAIFYIARQNNGRIWFATTQGLRFYDEINDVFKKVGNDNLDNRFVYTLCIDHNDNVWAGMADIGLYRIENKSGRVTHWEKDHSGLNDNYVTCLYEDSRGTMCIGTNVGGLQFIKPKSDDSVETFGKEWQLSHYTICSIIEDRDSILWVSTNKGLLRLDTQRDSFSRLTTDNGLPTNQFNFASSLLGHDGQLYFGTVQGLVSFLPSMVKTSNNRHQVHWSGTTETIRLTYDEARQFTITYGVIRPATAGIVRYQIRVDGIDHDWRDVGTQHQFNGYKLAPGTYVLHVRANVTGEDWNKCPERQLKIIVCPPWWQSWWARLIYLLILSGIGFLIWYYYHSHQKSQEAIRRAEMENEKIRAIDQAKFEFFTSVSHELKTPLSLIVAPLKTIIRKQSLDSDGKRNLDIALKNTRKIEQLVDELVTYNKVETDSFRLYVQQGNPMEFLTQAVIPFRKVAHEKNIRLTLNTEDNGEEVWFSPQYVEYILSNLLSNAIKFTSDGGSVTVNGRITCDDGECSGADKLSYLEIEVVDTGIGIAKEELGNIFNRYYQTRRGHNATSSGWGIGLSLVKRLAEAHKGFVSVSSEIDKGSTFLVKICVSSSAFEEQNHIAGDKVLVPISNYKLHPSMVTTDTHRKSTEEDDDESRITLLVVEDYLEMQDFLRQQLSVQYRVLTANNGREALDIARREMIHLVISDVMMPEMDGFELCRLLKGSMDTSHIPVILLTAKSEGNDVATGYRAGADAYVLKPFDIAILEMQINNILKLVQSRQQEMVTSQTDDLSSSTLTAIDQVFVQQMKKLVEENINNGDFSIADITTALGISRSLLHVKMKSLLNMSMGDYIRHQRMERACQLLREGYNISETAYSTGFADPNYFSKTFKKFIGMNPTEYISQYRNNRNS